MASNVVSDNFETSGGGVPQLGGTGATTCKAWVNFNGTGTVAIRDSYNVSSITDNGTGNYNINYSNNMANTDYSISAMGSPTSASYHGTVSLYANPQSTNPLTISSVRVITLGNGSLTTPEDGYRICIQVFGD